MRGQVRKKRREEERMEQGLEAGPAGLDAAGAGDLREEIALLGEVVRQMRRQASGDPPLDDLLRVLDSLGRVDALEARLDQQEKVADLRLAALERSQADQEARLRAAADAIARLSTSASLAQIAQAAFAVILSAIAAYLGRR